MPRVLIVEGFGDGVCPIRPQWQRAVLGSGSGRTWSALDIDGDVCRIKWVPRRWERFCVDVRGKEMKILRGGLLGLTNSGGAKLGSHATFGARCKVYRRCKIPLETTSFLESLF